MATTVTRAGAVSTIAAAALWPHPSNDDVDLRRFKTVGPYRPRKA
jgi:hypothetical protein